MNLLAKFSFSFFYNLSFFFLWETWKFFHFWFFSKRNPTPHVILLAKFKLSFFYNCSFFFSKKETQRPVRDSNPGRHRSLNQRRVALNARPIFSSNKVASSLS